MTEIKKMHKYKDDAKLWTPEDVLEEAKKDIGKGGRFEGIKKMIVICLDDLGGDYNYQYIQCGMKSSECIALLELVKDKFKETMKESL